MQYIGLRENDVNRESYINANVLLNLLTELGKRDGMQSLLSILSLFCNWFDNSIMQLRAGMLDSIYHMTLKLFKNHIFGLKN